MKPSHSALLGRLRSLSSGEAAAVEHDRGASAQGAEPASPLEPSAKGRTLRVDVARLDRLVNLMSELAVARSRFQQLLEESGSNELVVAHAETDRLQRELQEQVMQVRMVPLGPTFRQFARTVRDVAASHGKLARLVTTGDDVEVDMTIVEHIKDPLIHMVRNSLDHGIEAPGARKAAGKDPTGAIEIRAYHDAGGIVVEVVDDGAGLKLDRIRERARERGLADPDGLSERELQRLIFESGFSTAGSVTELSGRGVGMDVVRRNIEALGGSVEIASEEGKGTRFIVRMPLTLAIIDGFRVRAGGETYVVPVGSVAECLDLPGGGRESGSEVISLRGEPLPCLRLRSLFHLSGALPSRESVLVVQVSGRRSGLVVDELLGESQTVIKPLGSLLRGASGFAGSTILGNGQIALILDIPSLVGRVEATAAAGN